MHEILNTKHWYIAQSYFDSLGPTAFKLLEQGKSLDILKVNTPTRALGSGVSFGMEGEFSFKSIVNQSGERVALIPLYGTMTKYGGLCSHGTADLANMIYEANQAEAIDAIIIDIDSPGGAADSVEVLERAIDASTKPVVAWVDRTAASGSLWVASIVAKKGKVIIDSLQNTEMGSIGALTIYQNIAARMRDEGVDVKIIRAPQSGDKAKINSVEQLTPDLEAEIKEELRELTDNFINNVKANYGPALKADTPRLFTGGMFNGKKALEIGLAHEQGDLNSAFDIAISMAKTQVKTMNTFKRLGLSFSIAQKLSAEELENLAEAGDKLAKVEELEALNDTLTNKVAELEQTITANAEAHTAAIAVLNKEKAALQAQLDKQPAAAATTAVSEEDEQPDAAGVVTNKYETSADRDAAAFKAKMTVN